MATEVHSGRRSSSNASYNSAYTTSTMSDREYMTEATSRTTSIGYDDSIPPPPYETKPTTYPNTSSNPVPAMNDLKLSQEKTIEDKRSPPLAPVEEGEDGSMRRATRTISKGGTAHLEKPIAIPAAAKNRGSPFLRAYAPSLEAYGISQKEFLDWIDHFNRVAVVSPPLQFLTTAGSIISLVPEHTTQIVGGSIEAAGRIGGAVVSKARSELYIRDSNKNFFGPRGLKLQVAKMEALAKVCNMPVVDEAGKLKKNLKKAQLLKPIEDPKEVRTLTAHERRLRAIEEYIAHLEIHDLPELEKPKNPLSKLNAAASERERKKAEKKLIKTREKKYGKTARRAAKRQNNYDQDMAFLAEREEEIRTRSDSNPEQLEKKMSRIEEERDQVEAKYERGLMKADRKKRKGGKGGKGDKREEKAMKSVLWLMITEKDFDPGLPVETIDPEDSTDSTDLTDSEDSSKS